MSCYKTKQKGTESKTGIKKWLQLMLVHTATVTLH